MSEIVHSARWTPLMQQAFPPAPTKAQVRSLVNRYGFGVPDFTSWRSLRAHVSFQSREDHAASIANWLDVLTAGNRAIFAAASHAQRAADFINGLQPASAA